MRANLWSSDGIVGKKGWGPESDKRGSGGKSAESEKKIGGKKEK